MVASSIVVVRAQRGLVRVNARLDAVHDLPHLGGRVVVLGVGDGGLEVVVVDGCQVAQHPAQELLSGHVGAVAVVERVGVDGVVVGFAVEGDAVGLSIGFNNVDDRGAKDSSLC